MYIIHIEFGILINVDVIITDTDSCCGRDTLLLKGHEKKHEWPGSGWTVHRSACTAERWINNVLLVEAWPHPSAESSPVVSGLPSPPSTTVHSGDQAHPRRKMHGETKETFRIFSLWKHTGHTMPSVPCPDSTVQYYLPMKLFGSSLPRGLKLQECNIRPPWQLFFYMSHSIWTVFCTYLLLYIKEFGTLWNPICQEPSILLFYLPFLNQRLSQGPQKVKEASQWPGFSAILLLPMAFVISPVARLPWWLWEASAVTPVSLLHLLSFSIIFYMWLTGLDLI